MVVFVVNQMHGAAGDGAAACDHGAVDVHAVKPFAPEGGQQGGVDVDHAAGEIGGNLDEMKKACHHHQIGIRLPAGGEDRVAPVGQWAACGRQNGDRNAGLLGQPHAADVTPARHHPLDARGQSACRDSVEEVFERPPGAREEHREAERFPVDQRAARISHAPPPVAAGAVPVRLIAIVSGWPSMSSDSTAAPSNPPNVADVASVSEAT